MIRSGDGANADEVLDSWEDATDTVAPGLDRRIKESLKENERLRNERKLLIEGNYSVVATPKLGEASDGLPAGPIRILKRPQRDVGSDQSGVSASMNNSLNYPSVAERYAAYNEVRLRIFGSHDPEATAHLQSLKSGSAAAQSSKHSLP